MAASAMAASAMAPFWSVVIRDNLPITSAGPWPFWTSWIRLQSRRHRKVTQAPELTGTSTPYRRPRRFEAGAGNRDPRHAAGVRVHRLLRHLLGRKPPADEV